MEHLKLLRKRYKKLAKHLVILLGITCLTACQRQTAEEFDESVIRRAFDIPQEAIKTSYYASPKTSGTFGRGIDFGNDIMFRNTVGEEWWQENTLLLKSKNSVASQYDSPEVDIF